MGSCLERQTSPAGKVEKEIPENYSNQTDYFIQQIVALIAHESYSQSDDIIETMILTYPFYSNSIDLLNAIIDRFFISYSRYKFINSAEQKQESINSDTFEMTDSTDMPSISNWISSVKIPIQRKCLDLLLKWMTTYWSEDFDRNEENHEQLMTLVTNFISDIKSDRDKYEDKTYAPFIQQYILKINNAINSREQWYVNIVQDIKTKYQQHEDLWEEQIKKSKNFTRNRIMSVDTPEFTRSPSPSAVVEKDVAQFSDDLFSELVNYDNVNCSNTEVQPLQPKEEEQDTNKQILSFLALKNQETAREYAKQLTLVDWEYFSNISCRECLHKILSPKDTQKHKSIKLFIDRFQQINQYVIVSIIGAPDLKTRIQMMEFFIYVAETLLKLNNLHSFMAVCSALDSFTVQKLKVAMEFLNKSKKRTLKEFLSPLCSVKMNYKKLRDYCSIIKPPGIPFLGLILKDLTFANDGNQDRLKEELDCHINFRKYKLMNKICKENIEFYNGAAYDGNGKQRVLYDESEQKVQNVVYMDLAPDIDLQNQILTDLNSYILLNKNVVWAMAKDANRLDTLQKEQYSKEKDGDTMDNKPKKSESKNIFQKLFSSSDGN